MDVANSTNTCVCKIKMALLKYFKKASVLPSPDGPLSEKMPSATIAAANKEVQKVLDSMEDGSTSKRAPYSKYSDVERARVAKRASEMGVTNTIRFFKKDFPDRPLKEGTVRTWKKQYESQLKARRISGKSTDLTKMESSAKRGRPFLLGVSMDKELQAYITTLREAGCVINSAIVMGAAEGIVKKHNSNLLATNGGHIEINKGWAKGFLNRMGFVKRRASTKAKVNPSDFESYKQQFVFDIQTVMEMEEIPRQLVINWDHTGIQYVPVSSWTMAKEGSKRVEIAGINDKRQITAVFANTMSGDFLPPQVIYSGKTRKCLPSVKFPNDWSVTYTQNHWANEVTTEEYIKSILLPYLKQMRSTFSLKDDHPALVIYDRFKGQCTDRILSMLDDNNIRIVIVPANCTDRLQPLDVSVNKSAKEFLRRQFHQWYSDQVCSQMQREAAITSVDLTMSVVKPLSAKWLIALYNYMKENPTININGFKQAGIFF